MKKFTLLLALLLAPVFVLAHDVYLRYDIPEGITVSQLPSSEAGVQQVYYKADLSEYIMVIYDPDQVVHDTVSADGLVTVTDQTTYDSLKGSYILR